MAASYPTATKSFTTKTDGGSEVISASHINDLQDEIVALEDGLRTITSFTPTFSSTGRDASLGNGTLAGKYLRIGKTIVFRISLTWGTTTGAGTGSFTFLLPSTADATFNAIGSAAMLDNGTTWYTGVAALYDTSHVSITLNSTATQAGAGVPITWAAGDVISISGFYFEA